MPVVLADYEYIELYADIANLIDSRTDYRIYFNSDITVTNYYSQIAYFNGIFGSLKNMQLLALNAYDLGSLNNGLYGSFFIKFKQHPVDGKVRFTSVLLGEDGIGLGNMVELIYNINTTITGITFYGSNANGIDIGSSFKLFGMKK